MSRLPAGSVLLPGLDAGLSDPDWAALDDSHPQAGLQRLLSRLDLRREEVRIGPVAPDPSGRQTGRRHCGAPCCRPTPGRLAGPHALANTAGLCRLEPADQQEEALADGARAARGAGNAGATAALVTPDRELAGRVAVG